MVTPGTRQHKTWRYLWEDNGIKNADVFVAHPKAEFVPPNVPPEKVVYMGAAIDLLDDLNRYLPVEEKELGWAFVNERLAMNENQQPLDLSRPYIVLIARFDESKGMPQGIEAYAKARRMMIEQGADEKDIPQLMIIGNGSVDDPSGEMMLNEIMDLRALTGALDPAEYGDIKTDLKVIRVPHNDVAINTVLKGAKVALQPSTKEGFESRVTDAIFQGVPVIGSTEGGIPLQIIEGKSGFVRNPYDTTEWGRLIAKLSTDKESYEKLVETTKTTAWEHNYQFTNIPNVISWLKLILIMTDPESRAQFKGNHRWVKDIEVPESALRVPEAA